MKSFEAFDLMYECRQSVQGMIGILNLMSEIRDEEPIRNHSSICHVMTHEMERTEAMLTEILDGELDDVIYEDQKEKLQTAISLLANGILGSTNCTRKESLQDAIATLNAALK